MILRLHVSLLQLLNVVQVILPPVCKTQADSELDDIRDDDFDDS
jgi:hypothetical protein